MKKLLLFLTVMGFSFGLSAQSNVTLEQIRDHWQSKSITVDDASLLLRPKIKQKFYE